MFEHHLPAPYWGRLKVTDEEIVPMGDVFAVREVTFTRPGTASRPSCEIVFEVQNGVPKCTKLALESDECSIRTKDLVAISLDKMRADFFAAIGIWRPRDDGNGFTHILNPGEGSPGYRRDRKAVEKATTRRKVDAELLRKVADIVNAIPVGGRIAAVEAAFMVKERQAKRYIAEAREEGLIND